MKFQNIGTKKIQPTFKDRKEYGIYKGLDFNYGRQWSGVFKMLMENDL